MAISQLFCIGGIGTYWSAYIGMVVSHFLPPHRIAALGLHQFSLFALIMSKRITDYANALIIIIYYIRPAAVGLCRPTCFGINWLDCWVQ